MNYGNGVSIDTDDVVYIEYGPYHTYTFKINRENAPADAPVENLILSLEPDGTYKELLKTYNLTQSDRNELSLGNGIDLEGKTTTIELAKGTYYNPNGKVTGSGCSYQSQQVYQACCHGVHGEGNIGEWSQCTCSGSGLPKMYTIEILVCSPEPGAPTSGWTPTPSSPTAPTGSGEPLDGGSNSVEGTNPTNPNTVEGAQGQLGGTPTLPILGGNPKEDSPCGQLKKINENTNIKAKFTTLKNNINGTNEKGILIRDIAGNETSDIIEGDSKGNIRYPYLEPTYTPYILQTYGTAHNHLANNPMHTGIFTPEDLMQLYTNALIETNTANPNASPNPKKAVIFVLTNKGYFALKITDLTKLTSFINWYFNQTKDEAEKYMIEHFQNEKEYNIKPISTHDQQVTGFLRFMKDKDIGIELYEGNKDTFGSWRKLNLVDNGNKNYSFSETPCNL